MNHLGATEILLILVVAVLLFGPGRVADIGKALADLKHGPRADRDEQKPA